MTYKEAKVLAQQWRDNPGLLAGDMSAVLAWVDASLEAAAGSSPPEYQIKPQTDDNGLRLVQPIHEALRPYCKWQPHSSLKPTMLDPLMEALTAEAGQNQNISHQTIVELRQAVRILERWAEGHTKHQEPGGNRSELLKATIEEIGDELILRTDLDGSVKLRGSTSIPMFIALWNAPKHTLSEKAFLDIDRSVRPTNLERHRNRLSARLHDVLIEIVTEKDNSVRLQKCP